MGHLTEKLKRDHAGLVEAFAEIKALGITHPDAPKKLRVAKAALLAHLQHEDVELYPALHKAAENSKQIKATLTVLAVDIENVAKLALEFFSKYESGGPAAEFSRDFSLIHAALALRIRREETTLYPLFDEITFGKKT